jgi:hypothetical protein
MGGADCPQAAYAGLGTIRPTFEDMRPTVLTAPEAFPLALAGAFAYRPVVIGLLRIAGVLNAAVWLGAGIFFTLAAHPGASSPEMKDLLGAKNYPFYSVAIGHLLAVRYFHLYLGCSVIAVIHLLAEWLYLGKYPGRLWRWWLAGVIVTGLLVGYGLLPRLRDWHSTSFQANAKPEQRELANRAYATWSGIFRGLNLLVVGGVAAYLWRVANPPDPARFVSATKFRS